jgi:hypothetical protein
MTPIAKPGFQFSHWEPNPFIVDTLNSVFEGNVSTTDTKFKAYFKVIPDGLNIHFSLFPNPTSGEIQIQHNNGTVAKECDFEIFDLSGRIIFSSNFSKESLITNIDVSSFRNSIYFFKITRNKEPIEIIRFVKL